MNFFTANTTFSNGGALGVGNNPGGEQPVASITQRGFTYANGVPVFGTTPQPPFGAFSVSQDLKLPYVINFNANIERQLGASTVVSIGYVGTRGHRLGLMRDINAPTPAPGAVSQARRPFNALYPQLAAINQLQSIGRSKYDSLQMSLSQGNWHGLSGRLSYTYGHALDNGSEARNTLPMDQRNIDLDWGNATFDVRHVVSAGFTYNLPAFGGGGRLGDGWQVNVIASLQSGRPFNITTGVDTSGTGIRNDRPNLVGDPYSSVTQPTSGQFVQYFNPAAFQAPAAGTYGNLARNALYGPGFNAFDFSVFKTTKLTDGTSVPAPVRGLQPVQPGELGQSGRVDVELDQLRRPHEHAQRQRCAGHRSGRAEEHSAGAEVPLLASRIATSKNTELGIRSPCPCFSASVAVRSVMRRN